MTVTYTVKGIQPTRRRLTAKYISLNLKVSKGLKKAGDYLKQEIESSIAGNKDELRSVDTGAFLGSIKVTPFAKDGSVTVYTSVPYAKYLEYGTSRIGARRHFGNSEDRSRNAIMNIIASEFPEGGGVKLRFLSLKESPT